MPQELETEESQNETNTNEENNESNQQESPPASSPSTDRVYSREDFETVSRLAQNAVARADRDRAELERIQAERRIPEKKHDFSALNKKMVEEGNLAEGMQDLINASIEPLVAQNKEAQRVGRLNGMVGEYIQNHRYSNFLVPVGQALAAEVLKNIGSAEPTSGFVKLVIDGLIGQALTANPNVFSQAPAAPQNETPVAQRSPMPPQIPSGRPASPGSTKTKLNESEKRVKNSNPAFMKMTDEDFLKELNGDQTQDIEYDMGYLLELSEKNGEKK